MALIVCHSVSDENVSWNLQILGLDVQRDLAESILVLHSSIRHDYTECHKSGKGSQERNGSGCSGKTCDNFIPVIQLLT